MATNFELLCYGLLCLVSFLLFRIIFNNPSIKNVKFPAGPMALPVVGHLHLLGPLLHQALHKLSCRYGPFTHVRFGSVHCVIGSSPEMARELLKTHHSTVCHCPKNCEAIDYLTFDAGPALKAYGPVWKYIKKISVSELLGSHSVHKYCNIRTRELHHLLRQIINKCKLGETLNLTNEVSKFTNNIISQAIISKRALDMSGDVDRIKLAEEVVSEIEGAPRISSMFFLILVKIPARLN